MLLVSDNAEILPVVAPQTKYEANKWGQTYGSVEDEPSATSSINWNPKKKKKKNVKM